MNFPLENPIFQFLYWLVDTVGMGGVMVFLVGGGSVLAYGLALFWIYRGGQVDDPETYTYPTPTLLGHHKE